MKWRCCGQNETLELNTSKPNPSLSVSYQLHLITEMVPPSSRYPGKNSGDHADQCVIKFRDSAHVPSPPTSSSRQLSFHPQMTTMAFDSLHAPSLAPSDQLPTVHLEVVTKDKRGHFSIFLQLMVSGTEARSRKLGGIFTSSYCSGVPHS